jgi:hypothetical protein
MRVNIGPYKDDIIPVKSWEGSYERMRAKMLGINEWDYDEEHYRWYDYFIHGVFDTLYELSLPLNRWSNNRKRTIKVVVDDYDVWSADHTLALIILPVLQRLKEKKQGSPLVDDADVPEELRSTSAPPKENEWDTDENHHKRWAWALDEMIWAFEQHTKINGDWEDQYIYNADQLEIKFVPVKDPAFKNHSELKINHQKDPSKPAYFRDEEAIKKHVDRMSRGRILFAKYYDGLWD